MTDTELRELLAELRKHADAQAPYFNDRLLTKIETIEQLLDTNNATDCNVQGHQWDHSYGWTSCRHCGIESPN